jgi:chaperonin GroEL
MIVLKRGLAKVRVGLNPAAAMREGVGMVARAVGVTLGPAGRNVLIENDRDGQPSATRDGVTVAKNVMLAEPEAEQFACLCRNSASEANRQTGDGTTTTTLLTAELVLKGLPVLESGLSIRVLKEGFDRLEAEAAQFLRLKATPITRPFQFSQVANIATSQDH